MYPWSQLGESKHRSPEPDERQAICLLYQARPRTCDGDELRVGYTCAAGSSTDSGVLIVGGVLLALCGPRRTRRSKSRA